MAAESSGRDGDSTAHPKPSETPKPTAPTADPETVIRFRLSDLDSILERNPSPFDHRVSPFMPPGQRLDAVPVIRIFGATDQGQRVVAHVHGAFPYVYVEYKGSLNPDTLNGYIYKLGVSLNRAMDLTQKQRDEKKKRPPQYIAFILACKGVPIYGYQVGYKVYLKIYFVNPRLGKALSELLRGGAVMNTKFDLYEDHIPFHLQFMLDANLYGSGWVEVSADCRFRNPLPGPTSSIYDGPPTCTGPYGTRTYTTFTVPARLLHSSAGPPKDTYCPIELDFPLHAIRNRRKLTPRDIHHDFVEYLHPDVIKEGKLVKSLEELWKDEERRRLANGLDPPEEIKDTAPRLWDERNEKDPLWAVEPELRAKIEEVAAKSLQDFRTKVGVQKDPRFETYVEDLAKANNVERGYLSRIRTAFEQVEGLFEERLKLDEQHRYEYGAWAVKGIGINVAKEAEAGDAARRAREQSSAAYEINEARVTPLPTSSSQPLHQPQQSRPLSSSYRFFPSSRSPQQVELDPMELEDLEQLSPSAFEYQPTPTQVDDSVPDDLPAHLRSHTKVAFNISTASLDSTSSGEASTSSVPAPQLRPSQYPRSYNTFVFAASPPTIAEVIASMEPHGQPALVYQDPYFSSSSDIPRGRSGERKILRWEHAGRRFDLVDATIRNVPVFDHGGVRATTEDAHSTRRTRCRSWEYAPRPPTAKEMQDWLALESSGDFADRAALQIEAPTQKDGGFKFTAINGAPSQKEPQHMALLAMELHTNTRGKLLPDPKHDEIVALFYCLKTENEDITFNGRSEDTHVGVIAVGDDKLKALLGHTDYVLKLVDSESELINEFIDMVRTWDPECVAGYEVHHASWGYLIERAQYGHEWSITPDLGRVKRHDQGRHGDAKSDRWGFTQSSTLNFTGRHVLPIWRILKADNKMQQNTFEHVAYHVLRQRTPHFSFETLTKWHTSDVPHRVARVFDYWRNRVEMGVEMLDAAETIEQNWRTARVFGVNFRSVRTRGSQFKVESVLFKLSKPESFMMLSPSRVDVGRQNAAECQPLIMEPQSAFYKGPLVVLDFTSLYPSVVIAHNYCWSTCLGRVNQFKGTSKLGTSEIEHPPGLIELLKDHVTVSPNGMIFAKSHIRKSLMAKMVSELLDTRVMVKASMKHVSDDRALTKLLNARQLALKFLANVTYGYIGATFSGRMPCVEVADAIVQTGRETLEKALETIHANKEWGAKVVYGDTDSLFVYLPGKTKEDAFRIGNEMADTVTSMNPRPMKLKFEKVYLPCVLVAKKRYVGYKFERLSDPKPEFEAKGLEVIRRDGTPATQKMQETTLKLLFETLDLSLVKAYCQRQWKKILAGDASPQDFIIAKKVKLGSYAENRDPPPGAAVAARAMELDPRGEPEHGERVPYILFQDEPGTKQVHRAIDPHGFLADPGLQIDAHHYITRALIPPLARIFNLVGVDIKRWWSEMPRTLRVNKFKAKDETAKTRLEGHFNSSRCEICLGDHAEGVICAACKSKPGEVAYTVMNRVRQVEIKQRSLHQICASCSSTRDDEGIACDSIDCPIMWERAAVDKEMGRMEQLKDLVDW
ncbi:hypothetical protein BCR35DRAFT_266236 [Leucosporidium creatinivorum]|uniref:DNA polymerase n=1 Tax=Leucosporidium creatinivorum TaxID=106004 RepID=A0A1Y2F8I8_9BASI|nr:hypothetical protein BCR35DRAFT_266236 [Leucosporidium creatinivorum]